MPSVLSFFPTPPHPSSSFSSTTTTTSTVTPSCYTTSNDANGNALTSVCAAMTGKRRRRRTILEEAIPGVTTEEGKALDYVKIRATKVRRLKRETRECEVEPKLIFVSQASEIDPASAIQEADSRLSPGMVSALEDGATRMDRKGRILFNPIVFLSKTTTNLIFTTGVTTTQASTATIFLATCIPSDVSSIIGVTCG